MRFVEVHEEFPSSERGNRVVHYFLKKHDGGSTLAVIGTESRNLRHMTYSVTDEFCNLAALDKHGSVSPAAYKWRSRREVLEWLKSFIWKPAAHSDGGNSRGSKSGGSKFDNEFYSADESVETSPEALRGVYSKVNVALIHAMPEECKCSKGHTVKRQLQC